ncbi:MAG: integrin alpha [Pseudomonadota bacterium]
MTSISLSSSVRCALGVGAIAFLVGAATAQDAPFPARLDLSTLDASEGLAINDRLGRRRFGYAVEMVRDVNGDGIDDLLVGAPYTQVDSQTDAGTAYLIFGSPSLGEDGVLDVPELAIGEGVRFPGRCEDARMGAFVSGAGDVDGDGLNDFLIAAPTVNATCTGILNQGDVYLIFGSEGLSDTVEFSVRDINGTNAALVRQPEPASTFKLNGPVGAIGDFNGDGRDDFVIGGEYGSNEGIAWVVFGGPDLRGSPVLELGELDGSNGFTIRTPRELDNVGGGGDLNGDGLDDLVIASPFENTDDSDGNTYILFGSQSLGADGGPIDVEALDDVPSLRVRGEDTVGGRAGYGARVVGDVNGDGFDDLALGDFFRDPSEAYLIFGAADLAQPGGDLQLTELDGTNGLTIRANPIQGLGNDVAPAGDVNGDGIDDVLIADANTASTYVLFGGPLLGSVPLLSTNDVDGLIGFRAESPILDLTGASVSGGKDLNADGVADFALGAPEVIRQGVYVVYGRVLPSDLDRDGVSDEADNCQLAINADQRDSNGDGYGNLCDADLNDDCVVTAADWFIMRDVLFTDDADADLDGDGEVDLQDARRLFEHRGEAPGPSGVTNLCD